MKLNNIFAFFDKPIKNRHLKYGVPFLCFLGVGLVVIRECATVRYEFRNVKPLDREELKSLGFKVKDRSQTLEEMYEEYQKIDIDNWKNVRGPRPWDEESEN